MYFFSVLKSVTEKLQSWHCAINVPVVSWNLVWHLAQVLSVSQTASTFIYEATSEQWTSLQGCCSCCHWPQSSKCLQSWLMSTCSHIWSCTTVCWLTSLGISVSDWCWREGRSFLSVNALSDLSHDKLTVWLVPFPFFLVATLLGCFTECTSGIFSKWHMAPHTSMDSPGQSILKQLLAFCAEMRKLATGYRMDAELELKIQWSRILHLVFN